MRSARRYCATSGTFTILPGEPPLKLELLNNANNKHVEEIAIINGMNYEVEFLRTEAERKCLDTKYISVNGTIFDT